MFKLFCDFNYRAWSVRRDIEIGFLKCKGISNFQNEKQFIHDAERKMLISPI